MPEMTFCADEQNDYVTKLAQYIDAIKLLEDCVSTFNRSVNERENLKKKVLQENETLAKKRLAVLLNGYKNASKAYEDCKNAITRLVKDKERVENEIKDLRSQIERTDIALDYTTSNYNMYSIAKKGKNGSRRWLL